MLNNKLNNFNSINTVTASKPPGLIGNNNLEGNNHNSDAFPYSNNVSYQSKLNNKSDPQTAAVDQENTPLNSFKP